MFGWGRPAPLRLVPFAEGRPATFCEWLCDGVTAHNLSSFAQLMTVHSALQQERPGRVVLATLDDLDQACYTCGHATEAFGLDDVDRDLSALPEELFDGGEHQGYFSRPEEFPLRLANLLDKARPVGLAQLAGLLEFTPDGEGNDFVAVNADPDRALGLSLEKHVLFQFVPVDSAADSIAAFPNGYFACDLSPMQNHALARHLESAYGLALFGIGSRYLAFRRSGTLGEGPARSLAAELASLYAGTPPAAADRLARLIAGRDWLLLRYTES
ncbi:MAG TPA: hypothetical protein VF535_07375 [Allosphingosinicella sp.]|jgi:hypothetical protein